MQRSHGVELTGIARYPVKGLSAEPMQRVGLMPGEGLPHDRRFALALAGTEFDPTRPRWLPKRSFLMLMRDEALAELEVAYAHDRRRLSILRGGQVVVEADVDEPADTEAVGRFFAGHLGLEHPPRLVESEGHMFSDDPEKLVSLVNLQTVRELEVVVGAPIAAARFRSNLLIDGAGAFAELAWVGRRLRIGAVEFSAVKRIDRCAATNVDPVTAERDLDIPRTLRRHYGHIDCGLLLRVSRRGELSLGDGVCVDDS